MSGAQGEKEFIQIGYRQLAWAVTVISTAGGLLLLPRDSIRLAGNDAWLTHWIPALYAIGVVLFFVFLAKHYPGKNIFQILDLSLGRWFGGLLKALVLLYIWLVIVRDISAVKYFMKTMLLRETPSGIIIILVVLLMMYFAHQGIEPTLRVIDILFPYFALLLLSFPLLLSNELVFERAEPMLVAPLHLFLGTALLKTAWYADIFILTSFLHGIHSALRMKTAVLNGIAMTNVFLSIMIFTAVLTLGPSISGKTMFLTYTLAEQINITEFLDRVEIAIFSLWFPITLLKIALLYLSFCIGLGSYVGSTRTQTFNLAAGPQFAVATVISFSNVDELFRFGNYAAPMIVFCVQAPVFAAVLAATIRKRKQKPEPLPRIPALTYSYVWLGAAGLSTAAGLMFAGMDGRIGMIAAFGYGVGIIASYIAGRIAFGQALQGESGDAAPPKSAKAST